WKARACRSAALRNIVPISRSNRLIAWSVRLAARSRVTATKHAGAGARNPRHAAPWYGPLHGRAGQGGYDALDARAPDQGRLRGHGPGARLDRASRPASPLQASGAARRTSSSWLPPDAAPAPPA